MDKDIEEIFENKKKKDRKPGMTVNMRPAVIITISQLPRGGRSITIHMMTLIEVDQAGVTRMIMMVRQIVSMKSISKV